MQVTLEILELPGVKRKLEEIGQNISNTAPLMIEMGNYLAAMTRDSFDEKKDPKGRSWTPLSNATVQKKLKKGKPNKLLFQEGDLQDRFIYHIEEKGIAIGTNANNDGYSYPAVHQFGTDNAWGRGIKVPARAFMPITLDGRLYDDVEKELEEIVIDFIESGIN